MADRNLQQIARALLRSRHDMARMEAPAHTSTFDQLESEVASMLADDGIDLDDPKVAQALMTVAGYAHAVLATMTVHMRQQEGLVHGFNVVLLSAVLAARRHAGQEADRG